MKSSKTYGEFHYDIDHDRWVITRLEPHVAIRLKQIFPRIPKSRASNFTLLNSNDVAADLEWFLSRYPLKSSPEDSQRLSAYAHRFFEDQAEREQILLPSHSPSVRPGLLEGQAFRGYQNRFLDYLEATRSLLLIDDVGLGKTYEGLGVGLLPGALPMVIVVEPHLQQQWIDKAESFINLSVHGVKGNKPYSLPPADIYVVKYNQLSPWVDVLTQGWVNAIVFDEVQQLRRGEESGKGRAARQICSEVPIRVGLTATLIYNYGVEAFNIADLIRPGVLGERHEFLREWCGMDSKGVVRDPDALGAYLRECHVMLRRSKQDVGQEAKQTAPDLQWVEPNTKAVKESEDLAAQLAMTTLTGDFQSSGMAARELDMRLREMTGVAKARSVAAYVRMVVESGQPVVLFGWHREVYRIWEQELGDLNPAWYTGSESPTQKNRSKEAFVAGETNLLIMSLRSGAGTDGIQHRCSTVIFGELDWSPQIHLQCIGRLDRDGQEDEVFVIYVVTNYGSDPVIIDMQGLKSGQNRGITDPGKASESKQANGDRIKALARHYLAEKGQAIPETNRAAEAVAVGEQVSLL